MCHFRKTIVVRTKGTSEANKKVIDDLFEINLKAPDGLFCKSRSSKKGLEIIIHGINKEDINNFVEKINGIKLPIIESSEFEEWVPIIPAPIIREYSGN